MATQPNELWQKQAASLYRDEKLSVREISRRIPSPCYDLILRFMKTQPFYRARVKVGIWHEDAKRLYSDGHGYGIIARKLGVTKHGVIKFIKKAGLRDPNRRQNHISPEKRKQIGEWGVMKLRAPAEVWGMMPDTKTLDWGIGQCVKRKPKTNMDRYYANHEENKRKARERGKRVWKRRKTEPNYKLRKYLSVRIWHAVKSQTGRKHFKTERLTGCSISQLKRHLESKFEKGMTWSNYGPVWHIDHIIPCAAFDLSKAEEQLRCFHWTNLQPLFASDNRKKHAKMEHPMTPTLI